MNRTQQAAVSTRSVKMAALLACLYFAFSPTVALATDVRLVNYAAYTYMNNTANLRTDGVENFDAASQSGP